MSIEAFQYVTMVQAAKPSCGTGSAFESLPCHFNFFDKECESNMTLPVGKNRIGLNPPDRFRLGILSAPSERKQPAKFSFIGSSSLNNKHFKLKTKWSSKRPFVSVSNIRTRQRGSLYQNKKIYNNLMKTEKLNQS